MDKSKVQRCFWPTVYDLSVSVTYSLVLELSIKAVSRSKPDGCTGWSKKRIPSFIFGITWVIQHRF